MDLRNFFAVYEYKLTSKAKDFLSQVTYKKPCLKLWQLFLKQSSKINFDQCQSHCDDYIALKKMTFEGENTQLDVSYGIFSRN